MGVECTSQLPETLPETLPAKLHITANLLILLLLTAMVLTSCSVSPLMQLEYDSSEAVEKLPYVFDNPEGEYLSQLRTEYKLEERVEDAETDLEKAAMITAWVSGLWRHHSSNQPSRQDPLTILREVEAGERFRCVEYAIVIRGALFSLGMPARYVNLHKKNLEETNDAHVVCEVYLQDLEKWVMIDGQKNRIPMLAEVPLSTTELQQSLMNNPGEISYYQKDRDRSYTKWIKQYMYYLHTNQDGRSLKSDLLYKNMMLVPKNLPVPKYYSKSLKEQGFSLEKSTVIIHDKDFFNAAPKVVYTKPVR